MKTCISALHAATNQNIPVEILKLLLEKRADPNLINWQGRAPIHQAIHAGNLEAVKTLINHPNTNLNLKDSQEGGFNSFS